MGSIRLILYNNYSYEWTTKYRTSQPTWRHSYTIINKHSNWSSLLTRRYIRSSSFSNEKCTSSQWNPFSYLINIGKGYCKHHQHCRMLPNNKAIPKLERLTAKSWWGFHRFIENLITFHCYILVTSYNEKAFLNIYPIL